MDVEEGVRRLREILPIKERQSKLTGNRRVLHKAILGGFAGNGAPLGAQACRVVLGGEDPREALADLAEKDLIVLAAGGAVQGAYPFTVANTPHRVTLRGHTVNAMCALDALAIAPMFGVDTVVESECEVSKERLCIEQAGDWLVGAVPTLGIHLGIQWGAKDGVAAHSL